ncbi:prolyl oligopeptidase family serine peptidase [Gemmatimonadota bacterium]
MRRPSFNIATPLLLLLLLAAPVLGQQKPPITPDDYGKWESLGSGTFSPDGNWLAYGISRVDEDGDLRIRSLAADSTKVVPYGSRQTFSDDSRWLAYTIGYSEEERERLTQGDRPVQNKMGLFNLRTGEEEVIEKVASFSFSSDGRFLAMRGYAPEGQRSGGVSVIVRDLTAGTDTHFGNVANYAWQDEGTLLALVIETADGTGNGIQLYNPASGTFRTLDSSDRTYTGLTWREESDDLTVLRTKEDEGYEDETHTILAWKGLGGRNPASHVFDHASISGFPADYRIVDFSPLRWADDGSRIFFGIKEWEPKPEEPERAEGDTSAAGRRGNRQEAEEEEEEEPAGVEVWHYLDVDIMPEQKVQANRNRRTNYLSVWHLDGNRFVQLANELTEDVTVAEGDRWAIGSDQTPYETERMFGPVYDDYYLIDVNTGERSKFLDRLEYGFGPSSGGKYFLYLRDDHYWVYDMARGTHTNITEDVPTSFVDVEDDHTVEQKPPFRFAGWTEDDRSVLLYDKFDIWEVRPDGSRAANLTNGAAEQIRYRLQRLDREVDYLDPGETFYLSLYGEWSKKYGYARMRIGRTPERLVFLDKNVGRLSKADDAEVYAYTVQGYDDSPDYFVGGPGLADAEQISETNPFQDEYAWGRSELVEFTNAHGQRMQGALAYPANYEPGRQYPMIVYIYEILSNSVHSYNTPSERSPYNLAVWNAEGYFVFRPDIVYRDRNPGLSAVECIVPAVEEVLKTGMIDRDRIGLVGHSWGAYQTTFVVTQTDLFAAGVAGAPLTDLVSMYLSIYWNSGGTDARIFEISQGRMEVPPWEALDDYMANSALFNITSMNSPLLVAFGTVDGAVDWHQGIELYNAARRAEKTFVMLVYEGENHSLRQEPNQLDYHRRINEWFDHYLKGEEAPKWILEGVSFLEREKELGAQGGGPGGPGGRGGGGRGGGEN